MKSIHLDNFNLSLIFLILKNPKVKLFDINNRNAQIYIFCFINLDVN